VNNTESESQQLFQPRLINITDSS